VPIDTRITPSQNVTVVSRAEHGPIGVKPQRVTPRHNEQQGVMSSMKTEFSVTTHIQATPARVFWFLADPSTASVIDPAVERYEPEGGIMGLGVRNHIRAKMLGIPVTLTTETIEWEPERRMGFRSITPGRPVVGVATHVFEPCPDGTLYTWSMEFVPTGVGGRVTAALSAAVFGRNASAQGERVRRVLEAAGRPLRPPES
jgi:hypothetical protein